MEERYTPSAKQVLVLAQQQANYFKHQAIGTEHLLLALTMEKNGVAAKVLQSFVVTEVDVREEIEHIVGYGNLQRRGADTYLPYSPRTRYVLERAREHAKLFNVEKVGTEHILLALLEDDKTIKFKTEEGETKFVGYDYTEYETRILRYRQIKQKNQTLYQIVLSETPFYAESGGQVGDTGVLVSEFETIEIIDTKKENNLPIHIAKQLPEHLDAPMMACVDTDKRAACAANHSCTHLLDEALRQVLGTHVEQKGSLVTPDSLRFDFSHFQKVTPEQLREVEHLVNAKIREDIPLTEYRNLPIEKAKELGAIALFGEKYGDEVRVVQFGSSIEFCGGTHVSATGKIGMVKILSESSVAAGVRRIEAITGAKVEEMMDTIQDTLNDLKTLFNNAPDLKAAISKYVDENAGLKKQMEEFMKEREANAKAKLIDTAKEIHGVKVIKAILPMRPEAIKNIAFQLKGQFPENLFVVIGSIFGDKPMLTVIMSDDQVKTGLNAGQLVREAAKLIQGGGGGQPHFATAGGKNPDGLITAVDKIIELAGF